MDIGTLQGIGTIFAFIAFIGICWWAFSKEKKRDFDEAAQLPFTGDELAEENLTKENEIRGRTDHE